MALVYNTVQTPNGSPVRTKIEIKLIAGAEPNSPGFVDEDEVTILSRWASQANDSGYWSVELEPNTEITPDNTYYQVIERYPPGNASTTYYIRVPDAATPTSWVGDILIQDPQAIIGGLKASEVSFVPGGTITSDDVQAALIELSQQIVSGSGDANYVHTQNIAASTWSITHNLGKYPALTLTDTAGTEIEGDVTFVDINTVTVEFSIAVAGKAHVN